MSGESDTGTKLILRKPKANDASAIYKLVKDSKVLDVNSEYLYSLIGLHHGKTSAIIEDNQKIIGFSSAYLTGNKNDILFIWQIAIDQDFRGKGLALQMLLSILARKSCAHIKYIHLTISPSNLSSRKLFESLAKNLGLSLRKKRFFNKDLFSHGHEEEDLYIIGPLQ